jgi:hypothetical protein
MNDNLKRIDTALRLLADVAQELHSLRTLMTQPELDEEINIMGLNYKEEQVLNALLHGVVSFDNVEQAAEGVKWLFLEPAKGFRDQRKSNARRVIRKLVTKGYLYEHEDKTLDFGVT